MNSTMALNMPTSREYGRFTLVTSKYSSSTITTPRDGNLDSGRSTNNGENREKLNFNDQKHAYDVGCDDFFRPDHSLRPLAKITEYINDKPTFSQTYVPPSSMREANF